MHWRNLGVGYRRLEGLHRDGRVGGVVDGCGHQERDELSDQRLDEAGLGPDGRAEQHHEEEGEDGGGQLDHLVPGRHVGAAHDLPHHQLHPALVLADGLVEGSQFLFGGPMGRLRAARLLEPIGPSGLVQRRLALLSHSRSVLICHWWSAIATNRGRGFGGFRYGDGLCRSTFTKSNCEADGFIYSFISFMTGCC